MFAIANTLWPPVPVEGSVKTFAVRVGAMLTIV